MRFEVTFRNARIYALRGDFQWLDNSALLRANDGKIVPRPYFRCLNSQWRSLRSWLLRWRRIGRNRRSSTRRKTARLSSSKARVRISWLATRWSARCPMARGFSSCWAVGIKNHCPKTIFWHADPQDEGNTWSPLVPLDLKLPPTDRRRALVPSEVMVYKGNSTLFFATHDGSFGEWTSWYATSSDSGRTWGPAQPLPGELHHSTFVRNHIVSRAGDIILPFQHYVAGKGPVDPAMECSSAQMVVGRSGATGRSVYLMTTNTVAGPRML